MKFERIQIEATNYCNMRCSFCPHPRLERKKENLSFNLYKKAIEDIAKYHLTETISFAGIGEPLLKKDLERYIKFASDKAFKTIVTTNGLLLNKSRLKDLYTNGLNEIWYSLQTFTPEAFKTRGLSGNFSLDDHKNNLFQIVEYLIKEKIKIKMYISFMFNRLRRYQSKRFFPEELHPLLDQIKRKSELKKYFIKIKSLAAKRNI